MRVVELSTPIRQFQHDSTHSPWEKQHPSPKGDLCKVFQRVFHQHWPALGQKQFFPSALWCLWGLYQNWLQSGEDCSSGSTWELVSPFICHETAEDFHKSHRMGRHRGPSVQPKKQGQHNPSVQWSHYKCLQGWRSHSLCFSVCLPSLLKSA